MMSLDAMQGESRRAAVRAAKKNLTPVIVEQEDIDEIADTGRTSLKFPFLGNHLPKGWELKESIFVDISGFGVEGEPALTQSQFLKQLEPGYGYALIEQRQFQGYMGKFIPPKQKFEKDMRPSAPQC